MLDCLSVAVAFDCDSAVRFGPKSVRYRQRINANVDPPDGLVTAPMQLAMMRAAKRYSKFIADFAAKRARLCKSQVVRIRRLPTAEKAWTVRDIFDVLAALPRRIRRNSAKSTLRR